MKPSDYSLQFVMNNLIAFSPLKEQTILTKNKALKRLIYGLLAFLTSLSLFSFKETTPPKKHALTDSSFRIKTIIVDAGHGNRAPGQTRYSPGSEGSYSL